MGRKIACYAPRLRLFDDEAVVTLQVACRQYSTPAVDAVEVTEKIGFAVGGRRQAVIGPRQVLARRRAHRIGSDDDDELGLALLKVAAAEQRSKDGDVLQSGEAVHVLAGGFRDQAGD